jgi:hypothetical protein
MRGTTFNSSVDWGVAARGSVRSLVGDRATTFDSSVDWGPPLALRSFTDQGSCHHVRLVGRLGAAATIPKVIDTKVHFALES